MFFMMINYMFLLILSLFIMMIAFILSKKKMFNLEKLSPFECGFDLKSPSRLSFSLHFFLIMILFLIFDVEITIIFSMIISMNSCELMYWFYSNLFFFLLLLIGLYHEWNQKMLNWSE
nr:NADH dehydrogenase subunit 3 [Ernodes articularis]